MQQMSMAEEYNRQGRDLYGLDKYSEAMTMYRKAEGRRPVIHEDIYEHVGAFS